MVHYIDFKDMFDSTGNTIIHRSSDNVSIPNKDGFVFLKVDNKYIPMHEAVLHHLGVDDTIQLLHDGSIMLRALYSIRKLMPAKIGTIIATYIHKYGEDYYKSMIRNSGLTTDQVYELLGYGNRNRVNEYSPAEKTAADNQIRALMAKEADLEQRIKIITGDSDEKTKVITRLEGELKSKNRDIDALEARIHEVESSLKSTQDKSSADLSQQATELSNLRNSLQRAAYEKAKVERDLNEVTKGRNALQLEIASVRDRISTLEAAIERKDAEIQKIQTEGTESSSTITQLRRDMERLNTELKEQRARADQLERDKAALEGNAREQANALQLKYDEVNRELLGLRELHARVTTELDSIKGQHQSVQAELASKNVLSEKELTNLRNENSRLATETHNCTEALKALQQRITELDKINARISSELEACLEREKVIQNLPSDLTNLYNDINTRINNLRELYMGTVHPGGQERSKVIDSINGIHEQLNDACRRTGTLAGVNEFLESINPQYTLLYKDILNKLNAHITEMRQTIRDNNEAGIPSDDLKKSMDVVLQHSSIPQWLDGTINLLYPAVRTMYEASDAYINKVAGRIRDLVTTSNINNYINIAKNILSRIHVLSTNDVSLTAQLDPVKQRTQSMLESMTVFRDQENSYNSKSKQLQYILDNTDRLINDNEDLGAVRVYVRLNMSETEYKSANRRPIAGRVIRADKPCVQFTENCDVFEVRRPVTTPGVKPGQSTRRAPINIPVSSEKKEKEKKDEPEVKEPFIWNTGACASNTCGPFYEVFSDHTGEHVTTNEDIFNQMVYTFHQLNSGYNIAIFGTGYSGSGKTHTLFGNTDEYGITQYALQYLLNGEHRKGYKVRIENIDDLHVNRKDDAHKLIGYLDQFKKYIFSDVKELFATLNEIKAVRIKETRIKSTPNNTESSRAHLVLTFSILDADNIPDPSIGKLTIIDMGGMENITDILNTYRRPYNKNNADDVQYIIDEYHLNTIGFTSQYFATVPMSKRQQAMLTMIDIIQEIFRPILSESNLQNINARLVRDLVDEDANSSILSRIGIKIDEFSSVTSQYVEYIRGIVREGIHINKSIAEMQEYFGDKTSGFNLNQLRDKSKQRYQTGMYQLLYSLEKSMEKPTKFINLVMLWNNASSAKYCIGSHNAIKFALDVSSTT